MTNITAVDLHKASSKHRMEEFWKGHREARGCDPQAHRNPNTIQGFLTKEKVAEMFLENDHDQLLTACGLTFYENDEVVFLTDDYTFGFGVLPKDFLACSINGMQYQFGEGQKYPSVDAILERYCAGKRHLNSIEELLEYLNRDVSEALPA